MGGEKSQPCASAGELSPVRSSMPAPRAGDMMRLAANPAVTSP